MESNVNQKRTRMFKLASAFLLVFLMGYTPGGCGPDASSSGGGGGGGTCQLACPNGQCLSGGVCCPGNYPNYSGADGMCHASATGSVCYNPCR